MKLNLKEYLPLCLTTEAPPENVGQTYSQDINLIGTRVTHGILGLASEIEELLRWYDRGFYLQAGDVKAWRTNLKEELGDLYWYCGILLEALGQVDPVGRTIVLQDVHYLELHTIKATPLEASNASRLTVNAITDLSKHVGVLADKQKRFLHYAAPYELTLVPPEDAPESELVLSPMMGTLNSIFFLLHKLCQWHGLEAGDVRDANIRKLYKRFRDKFNANKALNRDLLAEYEALSETPNDH